VFSNTFGKASTAVITDFLSVDEIADMDIEDLVNFICKKGKNRFSDPGKVAQKLFKKPLGAHIAFPRQSMTPLTKY
jgi:hypothetical protein